MSERGWGGEHLVGGGCTGRLAQAYLSNSSLKGVSPQMVDPPVPSPLGHPPWIMKPLMQLQGEKKGNKRAGECSHITRRSEANHRR